MATSFSDGRSQSARREPPTMGKQLVNCIIYGCESKTIAHNPLDQLVPSFINAIWVFSLILKIFVAISDIFVMLKIIFAQRLGPMGCGQ
jgi:hypothetical protein